MLVLEPGTIFARDFKVVRSLARGGMGSVYEVEQVSTGKPRALKLLHAQLAGDAKIRQRFEQEARVGGRIESDHVVDVVAAGVEEPGTPWLVMEFLKGVDLGKHLEQRGALQPSEVLEIFRQVGHALAAAHRAGLVHRDLKPENIFLAESRREGAPFTVKVLDFGIAKAIAEAPGRATQAMGTPFWMAPEQCEDSKLIQPATDVWALGLIAYSLLTGACYWRSAQSAEPSVAGVILETTVQPLEAASVRAGEYKREHLLPVGFDAWFARCVTRPIDQRYRDAAECVAALIPVLSGTASVTPVPPAPAVVPVQAPVSVPAQPMAPASGQMPWPSQPAPAPMAVAMPMTARPMPAPMPVPAQRAPWGILAGLALVLFACVGSLIVWRVLQRPAHGIDDGPEPGAVIPMGPAPMQGGGPTMTPMSPGAPQPVMVPTQPMIPTQPMLPPQPMVPSRPSGPQRIASLTGVFPMSEGDGMVERAASVERVLSMHTVRIQACANSMSGRRELGDSSALVVELELSDGGAATAVRLPNLSAPQLTRCLRDRYATMNFAHNVGGTYKVQYALR